MKNDLDVIFYSDNKLRSHPVFTNTVFIVMPGTTTLPNVDFPDYDTSKKAVVQILEVHDKNEASIEYISRNLSKDIFILLCCNSINKIKKRKLGDISEEYDQFIEDTMNKFDILNKKNKDPMMKIMSYSGPLFTMMDWAKSIIHLDDEQIEISE